MRTIAEFIQQKKDSEEEGIADFIGWGTAAFLDAPGTASLERRKRVGAFFSHPPKQKDLDYQYFNQRADSTD